MKSLIESLLDVDDNIENVPDKFLIGDRFFISEAVCYGGEYIFSKRITKLKPKNNKYSIDKIGIKNYYTDFDNNIINILCNIILNLPEKCIYDEHDSLIELSPYVDPFIKKLPISNAYIRKNSVDTFVFVLHSNKFITMYDSQGVPYRDQPRIAIFLKKK